MRKTCAHCKEEITPDEARLTSVKDLHRECAVRLFVGSVGHQRKTCSCFGGTEDDPPGMTPREAAQAARREMIRRQAARN